MDLIPSVINAGPPRPFDSVNNYTYYYALNERVTLNLTVTANPEPTFRWYRHSVEITTGVSKTSHQTILTIDRLTQDDIGQYNVVVSNSQGTLEHLFFVVAQGSLSRSKDLNDNASGLRTMIYQTSNNGNIGPQVAVVAGAASGGAAMTIIVVVTVILCRRRLKRSMSIDEQADDGDYNYIDDSLLAIQVNLSEEATEGVHNDPPVNGRYLSIEELEDGGEYNYINDSQLDNQVTKGVTPSLEFPPRPNYPTNGRKDLENDGYLELDSINVASTSGLNVGDKDGFQTTSFIDAPPLPPRLRYRRLSENDDPYYITPCSEIQSRTNFTTNERGGRVIDRIRKRATKVPGSPSWREFDDNDGLLTASPMDVPSHRRYRRLSENDDPYYITPCSDIRPRPASQC